MQITSTPWRIYWHWLACGWLWSIMYIGWWELAWRYRHRDAILSLRKGIGDDWFSNLIVTFSCYATLFLAVTITVLAYIWNTH